MMVVRPVRMKDLNDLYRLSRRARAGLTTLPSDKPLLRKRIYESVRSFNAFPRKGGVRVYLFVLEDTDKGKVVGTCSVVAKVGSDEPFYTYDVKTVRKVSEHLHTDMNIQYLKLRVIENGPTEIGTLFLDPPYRKHGNGRLLSLSRFLFMAQYRRLFKRHVIAEMRGVIDKKGSSPFWRAVGRHFYRMKFKKADLMSTRDKSFIEELVPRQPIYIPLLPRSAQKVIGKVHVNTAPALNMLKKQGFKYCDQVDIFEAGPNVKAGLGDIKTVKNSRCKKISGIVDNFDGDFYLIANVKSFYKFKVVAGSLKHSGREVYLPRSVACSLEVKEKDLIRYCLIRRRKKK